MSLNSTKELTVEELLSLLSEYNKTKYPNQLIGVTITWTHFEDGSGYLHEYITETVIKEFKSIQELEKFLKKAIHS